MCDLVKGLYVGNFTFHRDRAAELLKLSRFLGIEFFSASIQTLIDNDSDLKQFVEHGKLESDEHVIYDVEITQEKMKEAITVPIKLLKTDTKCPEKRFLNDEQMNTRTCIVKRKKPLVKHFKKETVERSSKVQLGTHLVPVVTSICKQNNQTVGNKCTSSTSDQGNSCTGSASDQRNSCIGSTSDHRNSCTGSTSDQGYVFDAIDSSEVTHKNSTPENISAHYYVVGTDSPVVEENVYNGDDVSDTDFCQDYDGDGDTSQS